MIISLLALASRSNALFPSMGLLKRLIHSYAAQLLVIMKLEGRCLPMFNS